jgi:hypothetical protein
VIITPEPLVGWGHIYAFWKGLKIPYHFHIVHFTDSTPFSVSRVLRDRHQSKTESELMFCCGGLFGVLVCCLCSMDEMLIRFSLIFDRWATTPMPPSEPTDGSVVTGCTALIFPPCFGMCCTILATQGFPCTMVARTVSLGLGAARSMWTFRLTPSTRP